MAFKAKTTKRDYPGKKEALTEVRQEASVRFNALLPESLYNRLREQAFREGRGRDMTKITIDALREYFERHHT